MLCFFCTNVTDYPKGGGEPAETEQALSLKLSGQTVGGAGAGLLGMCLGERRRLLVPQAALTNQFRAVLPGLLDTLNTFLTAELTGLNEMSWTVHRSGLTVALLEPSKDEDCGRTVVEGDTLAVEYEGSLQDGTVFDSSESRGRPFGPFVQVDIYIFYFFFSLFSVSNSIL